MFEKKKCGRQEDSRMGYLKRPKIKRIIVLRHSSAMNLYGK